MLARMADGLSQRMVAIEAIREEDAALVSFGIVQGLRSLIEMILMIVTGILFGLFWQSVVILLAFIPLRVFAGGYHAKTPMQCAVKTWILFTAVLLWMRFVQGTLWLGLIILAATGICIWRFAPLEDEHKPLEDYEVVKYRKKAVGIYLIELIMVCCTYVFQFGQISRCIVLGISMVLFVMMAAAMIDKRKQRKSNE